MLNCNPNNPACQQARNLSSLVTFMTYRDFARKHSRGGSRSWMIGMQSIYLKENAREPRKKTTFRQQATTKIPLFLCPECYRCGLSLPGTQSKTWQWRVPGRYCAWSHLHQLALDKSGRTSEASGDAQCLYRYLQSGCASTCLRRAHPNGWNHQEE